MCGAWIVEKDDGTALGEIGEVQGASIRRLVRIHCERSSVVEGGGDSR